MDVSEVCYLDNNATTRVAPEVLDVMLPMFQTHWGNPSSSYSLGEEVRKKIEDARASVADLVGAAPEEIIFTSCGTEANNTAFTSALRTNPDKRHIVSTAVEHSANMKFGAELIACGYEVTFVPVEEDGTLDICRLSEAIRPDTALVSVIYANNETGVLSAIEEIGAIVRAGGVLFHTDAVQAAGKVPIDVGDFGVDMLSLSAHKLYAPKGIGALYVRKGTRYHSFIHGGGQERGRRAGTENVPYIVGFGRAAELAKQDLSGNANRVRTLRDRLEGELMNAIPGTARNGSKIRRLPNTSNLSFSGLQATPVLDELACVGICASSGSACSSGSASPSHVLKAMGLSDARALGSIRFSLGRYNSTADVDRLVQQLPRNIERLRIPDRTLQNV